MIAVLTDIDNEIYGESSSEGCKSNKDRGALVMMESLAVDECAAESANWQLTDPIKAEKAMLLDYEKMLDDAYATTKNPIGLQVRRMAEKYPSAPTVKMME